MVKVKHDFFQNCSFQVKDTILACWRSPRANPTKSGRGWGGVELVNIRTKPKARRGIFVNGLITSQHPIVPLGMDTIGEEEWLVSYPSLESFEFRKITLYFNHHDS